MARCVGREMTNIFQSDVAIGSVAYSELVLAPDGWSCVDLDKEDISRRTRKMR